MIPRILTATILLLPLLALADGPADNIPANVRRVPKLGIEVPAERKAKLEAGLKELDAKIAALKSQERREDGGAAARRRGLFQSRPRRARLSRVLRPQGTRCGR